MLKCWETAEARPILAGRLLMMAPLLLSALLLLPPRRFGMTASCETGCRAVCKRRTCESGNWSNR